MTTPSCLIRADLTGVRLINGDDAPASWNYTRPPDTEQDSLALAKARIAEAAGWIIEHVPSKKLAYVCLDVHESSCQWLKAPSNEAPVLAASFKNASEDWGELVPTGTIEALSAPPSTNGHATYGAKGLLDKLNRPVGAGQTSTKNVAAPVIHAPDTLVRLWLDTLDGKAIRPRVVGTLWHAMACAWEDLSTGAVDADDQPLTAIVLLDEPGCRAIWAWSRRGELVVGGHTTLAPHLEDQDTSAADSLEDQAVQTASRLALDWLSWAGQLSATPDSMIIVGPGDLARTTAQALGRRWPSTPIEAIEDADPLALTVSKASETIERQSHDSPRQALLALTSRPTRLKRLRYRWSAVALVLLALSLSAFSLRLRSVSAELASRSLAARASADEKADELGDPGVARSQSKSRALRSVLQTLQSEPDLELPPDPEPIYSELQLVLDAMAPFADDGDLIRVSIDARGRSSMIQFTIADVRRRTALKIAIEELDSEIAWKATTRAVRENQLQMEGRW